MTPDDNFAHLDTYETAAAVVACIARSRQYYLIFIPPLALPEWPELADIADFVIYLDRGDDEMMCISPTFWPYARALPDIGAPLQGVILIPKSTPAALVGAVVGLGKPVPDGSDILLCRTAEFRDRARVPLQRLFLDAIRSCDPVLAARIEADAEQV